MRIQTVQKNERAVEFQPLCPLTTYPRLPLKEGRSPLRQEKEGLSLMPNFSLESKVNKLYDVLAEIEDINAGDEDIEWCVSGIKDYLHTLNHIVEDTHHAQERAY